MGGVVQASVNLATEKASIQYDPSRIKSSDLIGAVESLGYHARMSEDVTDRERELRERELKAQDYPDHISGSDGALAAWNDSMDFGTSRSHSDLPS